MTLPQPIPGAVPAASAADEQQATVPQQQRPRAPATTRNGRSRSNTYAYNRLDADGNVHHLPPDAPALSSSRSRRSPPGSRSPTTASAHSPAGPTSGLSGGAGILELLGLSPRSSTSNALHIPFASSSGSGSGSSRPSGPAHGASEPGPSASPSASPASSVTSADEMPRTPGAVTPPELSMSMAMSMSTLTDTDTGLGKSTRRGGEWGTARALDIDYALEGDAFDEDSSTVVPELASSSSSRRWQRAQAQGHGRGYGHHRSSSVVDRSRDSTAPALSASTSTSAAPQGTGANSGYAGGAELGRRVSWSPGFYESGSSSSANSGPGRSSVLSWLHGQQSSSSSSYGSPPAANANVSAGGAGDSGNNPVGLFRRLSISSRRPVAATLAPAAVTTNNTANATDERTGRPAGKVTSPAPRKLSPMGERMLRSDSSLFS